MIKIRHEEIGGGYSIKKKIIIDATYIGEFGYNYEVFAMYEDGEELETVEAATEKEAIAEFERMIADYAEPLQKAFYGKLVPGKRYTLIYNNEFGYPVADRITFENMYLSTYAQYSDVVKLRFKRYKKRKSEHAILKNQSILVFEGWQELKKEDVFNKTSETENCITYESKYHCFDARFIEDAESKFNNPVIVYKNYKKGVNRDVLFS